MLEIDGSLGEGGGQVLRTSLALSAVLGKPITIYNIRKKRARPGLRHQHLLGVQLVEKITNGRVVGARLDSMRLEFYPGDSQGVNITANVGTAGAVTLVIQTVLLPLLFAGEPSRLKIIGGTDVEMAPTADYYMNVFLRFVRDLGADVKMEVIRRGFYPRGGGSVVIDVRPLKRALKPLRATRFPTTLNVLGSSVAGGLPRDVAERQAKSAKKTLEKMGIESNIEIIHYPRSEVLSPGSSITLWCEEAYLGASSIGSKGVPADIVGKRAANYLMREIDAMAPLDRHMGDQVIPFLALADGTSEYITSELTLHAVTNLSLIEKIAGASYEIVEGGLGKRSRVVIEGIGLEPAE